MSTKLSVVLCSKDPNDHVFRNTLEHLNGQLLSKSEWELVIVDNNSSEPICDSYNCSWHPNVLHLKETKAGLTHARLAGINNSRSKLVIFVDDDNWLEPNYLSLAIAKGDSMPELGTWGGQLIGEFQSPPPPWTERYWNWLAVRTLDRDLWSNVPHHFQSHPYGAGMCVRRDVCETYANSVASDARRAALDRVGDSLMGGGDADLNYTAQSMGLGCGVFVDLVSRHYMPSIRTSEAYLLKLVEDMSCSSVVVQHIWGKSHSTPSRSQRVFDWYRNLRLTPREREFEKAKARGRKRGVEMAHSL